MPDLPAFPPLLPPHSLFLSRSTLRDICICSGKGSAQGIPLTGTNIVDSLRYSVWTLKSIKWQIEFRQKMAIGGSGGHKNYMSFCRELQSTRHQRECQFNNCSNNSKSNNSKRKRKTTKITKRRRSRSRQCRRLFATGQPTVHSVPGQAN